jgi:hypothetical protein
MDSGPLHIASLADPLLRLLLGSDAFRMVQENDLAKLGYENYEAGSVECPDSALVVGIQARRESLLLSK